MIAQEHCREGGTLSLIGHTSTGGSWPRSFKIDPTGAYMMIANQRSDSVNVLRIDPKAGQTSVSFDLSHCPNGLRVEVTDVRQSEVSPAEGVWHVLNTAEGSRLELVSDKTSGVRSLLFDVSHVRRADGLSLRCAYSGFDTVGLQWEPMQKLLAKQKLLKPENIEAALAGMECRDDLRTVLRIYDEEFARLVNDRPASEPRDLLDFAERVHDNGWSLRAALVRYAQLAPERASALFELIRRTDGALKPYANDPTGAVAKASELLAVARQLDTAGEVLARWAERRDTPPHAELDAIARQVFNDLAALGVERETWDGRRRR